MVKSSINFSYRTYTYSNLAGPSLKVVVKILAPLRYSTYMRGRCMMGTQERTIYLTTCHMAPSQVSTLCLYAFSFLLEMLQKLCFPVLEEA